MIALLETMRSVFAILMVFSVTIFVHELGHFLFMKLFGVRVERFAIGFGKRLFGFDAAGTDFCVCAFPFGGYVKPVGMHSKEFEAMMAADDAATARKKSGDIPDEENAAQPEASNAPPTSQSMAEDVADEVAAMRSKAWWQKVIILSAGCAFNLVAAAFAIFLLFFVGHHISPPLAPRVETVSGLEKLVDVRKGDLIVAVNGTAVTNADEVYDSLQKAGTSSQPTTVALTLERDGRRMDSYIPVHPTPDWPGNLDDIAAIEGKPVSRAQDIPKVLRGITDLRDKALVKVTVRLAGGKTVDRDLPVPALAGPLWFGSAVQFKLPPYIEGVLPNLPADKAGLRKGDLILSVAGQTVESSNEARDAIMARINKATEVRVQRKSPDSDQLETKTLEVNISPDPLNPDRGRIGIYFGQPKTQLRQYGFFQSVREGFVRVGTAISANWNALGMVFGSRNLSFIGENIGGPIAIGVMTAKAAGQGWVDLTMLFVSFNVMLAIINIMPIPVLDGGHIVFATVEAIIRRPIPIKAFVWIHNVFIVLILGLALTLTLNDVFRNAWRVLGLFQ